MQGFQEQFCFFHNKAHMTLLEYEFTEQFGECRNVWIYQHGWFLKRRSLQGESYSVKQSNTLSYVNIFNISNQNNQIPDQIPIAFEEEKQQIQSLDHLSYSYLSSCLVEDNENPNVTEDVQEQDTEVTRFMEDLPYIHASLLTNTGKRQGLMRLTYFSLFDRQIELVEEIRGHIGSHF